MKIQLVCGRLSRIARAVRSSIAARVLKQRLQSLMAIVPAVGGEKDRFGAVLREAEATTTRIAAAYHLPAEDLAEASSELKLLREFANAKSKPQTVIMPVTYVVVRPS